MQTYQIATGRSRMETQWMNKDVTWDKLVARLKNCKRTPETTQEYKAMSRTQKGKVKDVGGFVGGIIKNGVRKNPNISGRTLITLDIDYGSPDTLGVIEDLLYGTAWCVYSTHSHTPATPRYRLILPLSRTVAPDEYIPIARRVASDIGIDLFDDSTYEPARLMYWPSAPRDGEYIYRTGSGEPLDADKCLATYDDWRNAIEWPVSHRVQRLATGHGAKQEDPTIKPGVIGAFCRAYTITQAIETFLPGVYAPTTHDDRWTYVEGSTEGGMLVYGDKFAYSHHGTDPCCEKLVNAFDLVRLHRFGTEDKEADPDTPINRLPSFVAMERFARDERKTSELLAKEKLQSIGDDFSDIPEVDMSWITEMQMDERKKNYLNSPYNFGLIVRNDPRLKGCTMRDIFQGRDRVVKDLPWREKDLDPYWNNTDDNGLIEYVSKHYQLTGKTALLDANDIATSQIHCHPVREYIQSLSWDGTKRLDTLLIDYLGVEDTELVRAMTRKHFTAAVARVMQPGIKYDYILTLIGPEGIGKSSLIRYMGRQWFDDSLSTIEGKEGMEQIRGKWLIEIGELTNYKKSTSEAYKAFISKQEDSYRPAYGRKTEVYPRQCVFFATTNERAFLKGDTGNRRFWTVECSDLNSKNVWEDLPGEVDQLWAEAYDYYKAGEPLYLSAELEHQARKQQEEHNEVTADERIGVISAYLDRKLPAGWESMTRQQRQDYFRNGSYMDDSEPGIQRETICAVEVLNECFQDKLDERTRYRTKEINQILRNLPGLTAVGRETDSCYGRQWRYRINRSDNNK